MRHIVTEGIALSVCRSVCHDRELCKKRLNQSKCRLVVDSSESKEFHVAIKLF